MVGSSWAGPYPVGPYSADPCRAGSYPADPLDIVEHMDLDEKFKRKQQVEAMLKKFRDMPESEHIKNFMKYERVNYKTQLYNKSRKIDSIMKQLNSNNELVEKD